MIWYSVLQDVTAAVSTGDLPRGAVGPKWFPTHLSTFEISAALASLIGVPLGLVGLFLTWREAKKARRASTIAEEAVNRFRKDLVQVDVVAELHRFCDGTSDLKRFLRANTLLVVPDRLSDLRSLLLSCRSAPIFIAENKQTVFQSAISFLSSTENSIESLLAQRRESVDLVRIAKEVTRIADEIQMLLIEARQSIGKND